MTGEHRTAPEAASQSSARWTPGAGASRWNALAPWLLARFGRPVHRVALDAGSECPNRDGAKGRGGCWYCDVEGSGTGALRAGVELERQLAEGLARIGRRAPNGASVAAVAYFQSYSNTYVAPARLAEVLRVVEPHLARPGGGGAVVAVALATRPDTLPAWALDQLAALGARVPVWVELGLECADDGVLARVNRLHTLADFEDAAARVRGAGLELVAHAILGLPGDGRIGARRTAEVLARSGAQGVKIHQLMVLERTQLAREWRAGRVETLAPEVYVEWLADFVERLEPGQVLHRLCGEARAAELLAPRWPIDKNGLAGRLDAELARRGTRQGALCAHAAP
jgi:radical SAM protein (TIGR01212 family)